MKRLPSINQILKASRRVLRSGSFDETPDGRIHLAREGAFLGGAFVARYAPPGAIGFGSPVISPNRVTRQGLIQILNLLAGHTTASALAIAVWNNDVEPQDDWTAANFESNANEFTAYTPTTRVPWTTVAAAATPTLTNTAALAAATITFNAGGPYTIRGAALLEGNVKESTTGRLIVASRFADDLAGMMGNGRLALEYTLVAMDEADAP